MLLDIVGKALANKKEEKQLIANIEEAYGEYAGLPIITAKRSFLSVAGSAPLFGNAFFPAKVQHPTSWCR